MSRARPIPSPTNDPLRTVRRRAVILWVVAAPVLAVASWWALRPLRTPAMVLPAVNQRPTSPPTTAPETQTIDPHQFAVSLWNPVPPPSEAVAAAKPKTPSPAPLNLQLVGIITESGIEGKPIARAALYDIDQDRLLIVADGERIREHTVHILGGDRVELTDGQDTRKLSLRPDRETPS